MGRQGLSQRALAEKLDWPQVRLSRRIGEGENVVALTIGELAAVAAALGVPVTQFLPEPQTSAA